MFADDTNLFDLHNNVKEFFRALNAERSHLNDSFCANKLSLNIDKTKYVWFHKAESKDDLPLILPDFLINDVKIKRENSLKFLEVIIDENLTWKTHVQLVENKISKSVGILFKASRALNFQSLRSIYFALVHPYINHANIAWASTNKTYLKKILGKQKQAARIMFSDDISIPLRLLIKELNNSNVYQINILQHLLFMFKVKKNITPRIFNQVFSLIDHLYPTRFPENSFKICGFSLKLTRFAIGFRVPTIWNEFFTQSEKCYTSIDVFKNKIKRKILNFSNEFLFFSILFITSKSLFILYKTEYFCLTFVLVY